MNTAGNFQRKFSKGIRIASSIEAVGVIEPLVVFPQQGKPATYMLLDGHLRLDILKERGESETLCIVSKDDESFTYNHKVNQISPIQEHFMILKAIEHGVSEDRIAEALNVDVARIRQKRDLLVGICAEAVQLLRDKRATSTTLRELKKVKPMRQIEMAELMVAANTFSASYAKCLYAATPNDQVIDSKRPEQDLGLSHDDVARLENEMGKLGREFKLIEETYGRNVLTLVVLAGYVKRLLGNPSVVRYLSRNQAEILHEFQRIVDATDLSSVTETPASQ